MQQQQQTHKEPSFLNISLYRQTIYISISFFPLTYIYLHILPTTTTLPKSYTITIALKNYIYREIAGHLALTTEDRKRFVHFFRKKKMDLLGWKI